MKAKFVFEIAQNLKEPYDYHEVDPNSVRPPYTKDSKYFKVYTFNSLNKKTNEYDLYHVFTYRIELTFAPWIVDLSKLEIPKRKFNGFELHFESNQDIEAPLTSGMDVFNIMSTIVNISKHIVNKYDMDFMIIMAKEEREYDNRRLNLYKKYTQEQMKDWTILEFIDPSRQKKSLMCKKEYEKYFASMLYLKDNPLYDPLYMGKNWEAKSRF